VSVETNPFKSTVFAGLTSTLSAKASSALFSVTAAIEAVACEAHPLSRTAVLKNNFFIVASFMVNCPLRN
jgi:hypothetical protein